MRFTYSGVTSTLALVFALSGGAYAATALPKNSVGPSQIKKNAVERGKIKNNAIDGSKVADGSLSGADIRLSSLGAVPLATNAGSATTATNATNATHAASAAALDRAIVRTAAGTATDLAMGAATAVCDAGFRPVSGGIRITDPSVGNVVDSYPQATGWTASAYADGGSSGFTVYVICAPVGTVG